MEPQTITLPWMSRWAVVESTKPRQGGQGSIKQVRESGGDRLGALKELLPDLAGHEERRRRMKQEVVGLIKVQGDGVPEVYDSNVGEATDSEELYLVQAWIEGRNLQQSVKKPLSIDESLELVLSLARIVERCHANNILHRDIKPDNIILDHAGMLYLVDFGIAWLPPEDRANGHPTEFGQELGNRFLRLPEMTAGQLRDDARSDVTFVVGILFYLLTAQYPRTLSFGQDGSAPHKHLRQDFPVTTRDDPRMVRLTSFFDVGFQYTPNLRFQSIARLIERLEEIQSPPSAASYNDVEKAVAQYEEMMLERETAQRHEILMSTRAAAVKFEQRIRALSAARHLEPVMMAGSPRRENDAWLTTIRFDQVTGFHQVSAWQRIEVEQSDIVCTYSVDGDQDEYYRGPAADTTRLDEEVDRHADIFFAMVLNAFVKKVDARRGIMGLFE